MSELMYANVGGIVPLSTVDWHGCSSIVIFLNGCPLRCGYCHNYHLLTESRPTELSLIKRRISESKPFVSAVVFLGGEPLMQSGAVEEISEFAKDQKLRVGIHTNGYYPDAVFSLLDKGLADKFFVDIKAPFTAADYAFVSGFSDSDISESKGSDLIERIQKTIHQIDQSPAELEIKTTVFSKKVGTKEDIFKITEWMNTHISQKQKTTYVLQQGKGDNSNDSIFKEMPFLSPEEMNALAQTAVKNLPEISVFTQTDEEGRVQK